MRHVGIWHVARITGRGSDTRVDLVTDGDNSARCEPGAHRLIPLGDRVCPSCYPSSYPAVARHRKDHS